MTDADKTDMIENALIEKFGGDHIWAMEIMVSPHDHAGKFYMNQPHTKENAVWETSRIDWWMLKNGANAIATAIEIKVSRADFKRDSRDKQAAALHNSHKFFYATPVGLLKKHEIPEWAGLLEIDMETGAVKFRIKSPVTEAEPSWQFMAGLIRKSGRVMRDLHEANPTPMAEARRVAKYQRMGLMDAQGNWI